MTALTAESSQSQYRSPVTLFNNLYRIETARRLNWNYTDPGWYFITICTHQKKCSFGTIREGLVTLSAAGSIAQEEMRNLSDRFSNVHLDRFVIMPNHVHAIIAIEGKHLYSPGAYAVTDGASPVSTVPLVGMQLTVAEAQPAPRILAANVKTQLARSQSLPHLPASAVETRLAASSPAISKLRAQSLADIVGGYKSGVSRLCHAKGLAGFAWQTRFHDHILRSNAAINGVRDYIDRNPSNWLEDPDRPNTAL